MLFVILFILFYLPTRIIYPTKVIGKKNLPKKCGYVLTCNHTSNYDPILIDIVLVKKIRFLAKKELFKNKLSSWFFKRMGAYPVDREKPNVASFKFALNSLKKKKILGIFPEGTRNKNFEEKQLQDLKSGAITFASKGETFIVPMILYNRLRAFHKNYLIIGEPLKIIGADPKRLTHEETDANTLRLANEMKRLREEMTAKLESKKNKNRKNDGKK